MALSYNNTGIIVASVSGAIVVALCVAFVLLKGRLPFTFSPPTPSCVRDIEADLTSTYGEYEKYGELYIAPDKQPTVAALDIMTRMLLVIGLPQKARVSDSSSFSSAAVEYRKAVELPRLCLTRPDRDSLNTLGSNGVSLVAGAEAHVFQHETTRNGSNMEHLPTAARQIKLHPAVSKDQPETTDGGIRESGEVAEQETLFDPFGFTFGSSWGFGREKTMVESSSFTFGSGWSRAELYRLWCMPRFSN
jgi:hypothetical protein